MDVAKYGQTVPISAETIRDGERFRAEMARFPNDSLTVIVLTNADGARAGELAEGIARIHLAKPAGAARAASTRRD